jgi:disulfide bond formation protein DsbB
VQNDLSKEVSYNRFLLFVLLLSFAVLISSFSAEYIFQRKVCFLCKLQRLPYLGLVLIYFIGLKVSRTAQIFCLLGVFSISMALGLYHFGVQQHIFDDHCNVSRVSNIKDFNQLLDSTPCSKAEWSLLGVPVSLLNAMISASLFFCTCFRLRDFRSGLFHEV